ncbi:radical SAM protein [Candidatus Woesearchaeota archaeon]|nr:radical SAM protein [Candidatus Woesearchaeota archaeon]
MQSYIASTNPVSANSWPGKISYTIYFGGCDYKCQWCYNADMLEFKEEYQRDLSEIRQEIKLNALSVDAIYFSGGEPLLQRQALLYLARYAKERDLMIGLETNGASPDALNSILREKLVDYIVLDMKTPLKLDIFEAVTRSQTFFKTTQQIISEVKKTIQLLKNTDPTVQVIVRTTIIPGLMFKKEDLLEIAFEINELQCQWQLIPYKPFNVRDQKYKDINPPSIQFLENLRLFCQKEYPQLNIVIKEN